MSFYSIAFIANQNGMIYYVNTFIIIMLRFIYFVSKMPNTRKKTLEKVTPLLEKTQRTVTMTLTWLWTRNLRNSKLVQLVNSQKV